MEKVKLFTHTDLDGIGCEIVGRLAYTNIDVTHCDYWNVNDLIKEFIEEKQYENYDKIYITDISVNEEVAKMIDESFAGKIKLIDHHATAKWLEEQYQWAVVVVTYKGKKQSGTNLFFDYLVVNDVIFFESRFYDAMTIFVEKVRRYDTWDWKEIYDDVEAGELNQLLYLIGRKKFADSFITKFTKLAVHSYGDGSWHQMFDKADKTIIAVDNEKKESYIKKKEKQMIEIGFSGHKVGVVFAEQYISELGNALSEMNPHLKYIAIVDMGNKKVSLRTVHDDIDLGKDVAKLFGGGGHAKASGFQFNEKIVSRGVSMIFQIGKLSKFLKIVDKLFNK
jgi:uncharacterized protein